MKKLIFITVFILMVCHVSMAKDITDYRLSVSKINKEAANLHVSCSFSLDFHDRDTLLMNFGGGQEFSVDNLSVGGDGFEYEYNHEDRNIVLRKKTGTQVHVNMDYDYTNLSAFFIYGEGDAELWETSFGEFFYPYVPNTYMDIDIRVETPDSLSFLCSYPLERNGEYGYSGSLKHVLSKSLTLAFFRKDAYIRSTAMLADGHELSVCQLKDMRCGNERYEELLELTAASIGFFNRIYGEDYISGELNVTAYPVYLFHNGKGFSNRYNIGFISASQEKFSTYPDIYPLVHEIGHRWLGEWTLLVDDSEPGAYFIKESLNEFMTLMFIRHHYGSRTYEAQLEWCRSEYGKIRGTSQDEPIVDVVHNDNNTVVYRKGPLVLDRIAREIGYDRMMEIISGFYREYAGRYPLKYTDFINAVSEKDSGAGERLKLLLETISL